MSDLPDDDSDDILRLIGEVHGQIRAKETAFDSALSALDSQRRASAAMQRLERTGTTAPRNKGQTSMQLGHMLDIQNEPVSALSPPDPVDQEQTDVTTQWAHLQQPQQDEQTHIFAPASQIDNSQSGAQNAKDVKSMRPAVMSGMGADFHDREHTHTHIVPNKKSSKSS